jgi:hypothetical protein
LLGQRLSEKETGRNQRGQAGEAEDPHL